MGYAAGLIRVGLVFFTAAVIVTKVNADPPASNSSSVTGHVHFDGTGIGGASAAKRMVDARVVRGTQNDQSVVWGTRFGGQPANDANRRQ